MPPAAGGGTGRDPGRTGAHLLGRPLAVSGTTNAGDGLASRAWYVAQSAWPPRPQRHRPPSNPSGRTVPSPNPSPASGTDSRSQCRCRLIAAHPPDWPGVYAGPLAGPRGVSQPVTVDVTPAENLVLMVSHGQAGLDPRRRGQQRRRAAGIFRRGESVAYTAKTVSVHDWQRRLDRRALKRAISVAGRPRAGQTWRFAKGKAPQRV